MGKVAITGGSGFIGSRIYRACCKNGDEVFLLDKSEPKYELPSGVNWIECDVSDKNLVHKVMNDLKDLDQLYLIAGVLGTSELNEIPSTACDINVTGLANFMDFVVKKNFKFPKVFYATKPNVWNNMYTITKEASEKIIQFYMDDYGLEGVIHKWFNVYGPGQHTHPVRKAVPYFILMALNNQPMRIHGDGKQTIDLIYVDDVAEIAVRAMNKPREQLTNSEVIDAGTGEQITVDYLAESIKSMCNSKSEIIHEPMRSGEVPNTLLGADTKRLREIIGDNFKFMDYNVGMSKTIEHYRSLNPLQAQAAIDFYLGCERELNKF